ncbi:MAG: DUF3810 domain-containing protein [Planctomycetes bacterium]|nr:DUF3810 domain-containing protein [Planctomycetota bacterium]
MPTMPADAAAPPTTNPAARERRVPWRRTAWLVLLALFTAGLWVVAAANPAGTEVGYSTSIFPLLARGLVVASGWLPFSLGEVLLLAFVAAALTLTLRGASDLLRRRRPAREVLARGCCHTASAAAVLFTAFVLLWGLNHARPTFAELVGLRPQPVTREALLQTLTRLAQRAAAARPRGFDVTSALPAGWQGWIGDAYDLAGRRQPLLHGPRPAIRSPWISPLLTLASTTGIYSPFTGEAHVNRGLVGLEQLFTACHEVAHLRGFAREDEANFIAWWVGTSAAERTVAYACEVQALRHVRGALRSFPGVDDIHALVVLTAVPQVLADMAAIDHFWQREREKPLHQTITHIATTTNDLYLKASGHADGARSYGRMVDLLVAALAD